MDNLDNIILIVVIIFSILSSIMKKKKKAESKNEKTPTKKKPGLMDIFKEFNKAMAADTEKPKTESEVDAYFSEQQTEDKKLNQIDTAEQLQAEMGAESFSNFKKPEKTDFKNTAYDLTYKNAENELNQKNINLHKFRKLLKDPNSLRDYILMNEILSKPKAFQDF